MTGRHPGTGQPLAPASPSPAAPSATVPSAPVGGPGAGGWPTGAWQRLHPLSTVVRLGRAAIALLLVLASALVNPQDRTALYTRLGLLVVVGVAGFVSWLVTRWRIADGALQVETGLVRRRSLRYPLASLQAVDIVRPGVARALGVAELRLRMASGGQTTGRLAYLPDAQAEALRRELLARASGPGQGGAAPATAPGAPRRAIAGSTGGGAIVHRVDTATLVASLLVSGTSLTVLAFVGGLVVLAATDPPAAAGAASGGAALVLSALTSLWQRFNAGYAMTVADAPEGLLVHAGLVERSAETIPAGRVQALRMVQPLTWRPFGWCRLEVDVAGHVTTSRRERSQRRAGRALLPVGSRADAARLVSRIVGADALATAPPSPPPRRAAWKAPLRYPHLSFGADARLAVSTSGRFRLVTDWVPLARLQSIRRVEGPLQRRLGLATVHLDTAGRSVRAAARDRDATEADALVAWLTDAARVARSRRR
ncbi:MAG TPA: PH domain-containing protein [Acidimicrobiales bacterium]|nr:PH domain-containing protein [Acidimicrobiales bacterium]